MYSDYPTLTYNKQYVARYLTLKYKYITCYSYIY